MLWAVWIGLAIGVLAVAFGVYRAVRQVLELFRSLKRLRRESAKALDELTRAAEQLARHPTAGPKLEPVFAQLGTLAGDPVVDRLPRKPPPIVTAELPPRAAGNLIGRPTPLQAPADILLDPRIAQLAAALQDRFMMRRGRSLFELDNDIDLVGGLDPIQIL